MKESSYTLFVGLVIGMIISTGMFILAMHSLSTDEIVVLSKKVITPEWKLITDGKVVDTLFIYKEK